MSITAVAIKRPLLIVVIFTVLIIFGIECYFHLTYNLLPKIQLNTVSVSTTYKGASASEIETSVTKKLEDAFSAVEGIDKIFSTSQEGLSQITVQLKPAADVNQAERDIQRKADQTQNDLPDNAKKPIVNKISLEDAPVIIAGVTSRLDPKALYDLIDKQLKAVLQNVPGVGQVNVIGGDERQFRVNISQARLKASGLTITQVTQAIANANTSYPAGSIESDDQRMSILYDAKVKSVEELKSLVVSMDTKSGPVYLRDIADVLDGVAKPVAINHINGKPSIGIQIIKQTDANAVEVSKLTKAGFSAIERQYAAQGIKFSISRDQSTFTLASANAVMEDLGMAVIIVGLVMLAFLHSLRNSLFVLVALPSSIIPTFIGMYVLGFSLNLMSLMALSLVVGILVDDSIVVLENIYRHLEMGAGKREAALAGREEIGFTALAITLVDVVVFLPLSVTGGLIGAILREFSLVVVISTLMSLFVSITVTPMLASRLGKIEVLNKATLWGKLNLGFERAIEGLKEWYASALGAVLGKKRYLLIGVIVLLFGSLLLIGKGFIGSAFIPQSDQGVVIIKLELAPAASLYQTNQVTQQVEKILLARPEVINVFSSIGFVTGSVEGSTNDANLAELTVSLTDKKHRKETSLEFGTIMQDSLNKTIPGVKVTIATVSVTGGSNDAPIQIAIKGADVQAVRSVAEQYRKLVAAVPGTQSVELSVKGQKPDVEVVLNREKMAALGLDAGEVGSALENAFSGNDKSKFKESDNDYDIMIGLDSYDKASPDNVRNLSFSNAGGQQVLLSQFAEVRTSMGESVLQRIDRINSITVNSYVFGRPVGSVAGDIVAVLAKKPLPEGISIEWLGDVKNQRDAFGSLGIALVTAILLVCMIMVALYESVVYPFVVLFSIPVALIGALLALALTMETLNIFSIIGIIMLLGLVSKNAILIVDFANHLKGQGRPVREALIEAGKERLRPILMTTMAMILGMLPIAMATGAGSEIKNGMAWAIVGGLTSSMVLTLFVVPSMYMIIEKLRSFRFGRKYKQAALLASFLGFGLITFGQDNQQINAAIDYPALRQGQFSTEAMGKVSTTTDLFGHPLFKGNLSLTRDKAYFSRPVLQWGANTLSVSVNYVNQHYGLDQIQNLHSSTPISAVHFSAATTGLAVSYARKGSLFGHLIKYSGTLTDFTDDLSVIKRVTFLGTVLYTICRTSSNSLSVGAALVLDPSTEYPVLPIVSYWHKFAGGPTELFLDVPRRILLRSQLTPNSWVAFGTELTNSFAFFNLNNPDLPREATYSMIELKTGPSYEVRFSRYLILGVHGGLFSTLESRLSKDNASRSDYFFSAHTNMAPYINLGLSVLPFTKPIKVKTREQ